MKKTKEEWRKTLAPNEFYILRKKGTERPFTGKYVDHKKKGIYVCAGCGNELFSSNIAQKGRENTESDFPRILSRISIATKQLINYR